MIKRLKTIFLCCVITLAAANVTAGETAGAVLAEAKAMYKKADNLQGAWVTTEKLIKQAEKALKNNNKNIALQLAQKARKEARLSYTQASDEAQNWSEPSYILKQ